MKVDVRIAYDKPDKSTSYLGQIAGQSEILDKHSKQSGLVKLSDAQIHWRILNSEEEVAMRASLLQGIQLV